MFASTRLTFSHAVNAAPLASKGACIFPSSVRSFALDAARARRSIPPSIRRRAPPSRSRVGRDVDAMTRGGEERARWKGGRRARIRVELNAWGPFVSVSARAFARRGRAMDEMDGCGISEGLTLTLRGSFARAAGTATPARGTFVVRAAQNKEARTRLSRKERTYNKARKSEITTRMKKVFVKQSELMAASSCTDDDVSGLESLISEATKAVDKAVARGVLHKNTGARRKARMSKYKHELRRAKGLMTA